MERVERTPLRKRAFQELSSVVADGAYASLLAIPVAIGVAAYTFVYLSLLRHRLRRRAEQTIEGRARAAPQAGDEWSMFAYGLTPPPLGRRRGAALQLAHGWAFRSRMRRRSLHPGWLAAPQGC